MGEVHRVPLNCFGPQLDVQASVGGYPTVNRIRFTIPTVLGGGGLRWDGGGTEAGWKKDMKRLRRKVYRGDTMSEYDQTTIVTELSLFSQPNFRLKLAK